MLESAMQIEDQWLARFKEVVRFEMAEAGGRARDGYRAAAAKLHRSEEYIYQLYTGKPASKPKKPSAQLMDRINEVYGTSNSTYKPDMIYTTSDGQTHALELKAAPARYTATPTPLTQAFKAIANAVEALDDTGRRQAVSVLSNLVDDPASCERLATLMQVIVETGKRRAA